MCVCPAPGRVHAAPCSQVRGGRHAGLAVPVREGAHRAVLERVAPSCLTAACAGEPPMTTAEIEKNKHNSFIYMCTTLLIPTFFLDRSVPGV